MPKSAPSDTNPAQVYIIRERSFLGFGLSLAVMHDNKVVCRLQTGEYVMFEVKPGVHTLGLSEPTIAVAFLPKRKYYFLIKTWSDQFGFEIESIDDEIGNYLVSTSDVVE